MRWYLEALVDDANTIPIFVGMNVAAVLLGLLSVVAPTSFWFDVSFAAGLFLLAPYWIRLLRRRAARIEQRGWLRKVLVSVAHAVKL